MKALLVLEDGTVFNGFSFGASGMRFGEVVFNTSLTGYQEILTDPSYKGQIVTMTYPLIGNCGINYEDIESRQPFVEGFVVKECSKLASNWRSRKDLSEYLKENNILGIEGIDTRALTRHIRLQGSIKAVISTEDFDEKSLIEKAKASPGLTGVDLVKEVTSDKPYDWFETTLEPAAYSSFKGEDSSKQKEKQLKVVVIDCGVKFNILRILVSYGCEVVVVPANTSAKQILAHKPNGLMISNGPGDPAAVPYVAQTIKELIEKQKKNDFRLPMMGICLGQQILGLAMSGKTHKLKFGHHGGNHPVKDLATGKVYISVQNHGFCLDIGSLNKDEIEITHINLNDQTLEGIRHKKLPIFSVQFHPECSPGPHDTEYLFENFISMMEGRI